MPGVGSLNALVIDGSDTFALARFWAELFETAIESVENEGHYIDLAATDRMCRLRFQRVPEGKVVKNRLHLDIEVDDIEAAVSRVLGLGGSHLRTTLAEYGWDYAVVADPEANEFCLIHRSGT